MPDTGGIEAIFYWKTSSTDLTDRDPSLQVVAVPLDDDEEFLLVAGGVIRMQVLRKNVNDNDLDKAIFGDCSGNLTVYPGYLSRQQAIPVEFARTYYTDWAILYSDERYYFITARYSKWVVGEDYNFVWGKEG